MFTITSVEPQKKNPRRFNIFLNGEFGFGADEDTVVRFRLIPGKKIENLDLNKILFETQVGKLMDLMYGLFARRQRSEKEVRDYFSRKNFELKVKEKEQVSELIVNLILERLKQKGLVNDKEFAKAWVEARRKSQKKGLQVIKAELFQKGIDREIIEEVLSEVYETAGGEDQVAQQALEKKARIWRNLENNEFRKKGTEFLLRRGFNYQTAKQAIDKFLGKDYN